MKIIVSHDVDHLTWSEHIFHDLFIEKYLLKQLWWGLTNNIEFGLAIKRIATLKSNRLNRLFELQKFDALNSVKSTYFVAMERGLGLAYSLKQAQDLVKMLKEHGWDVSLHGMEYDDKDKMQKELIFFNDCGFTSNGIRTHYLRHSASTFSIMEDLGYNYDSSQSGLEAPYKLRTMWEFPISVMDVDIISQKEISAVNAINLSKKLLNDSLQRGIPYFTINFHDLYFDDCYPAHKAWYVWLIEYCAANFEFISFKDAILELELS